jgi:hypothetical protein
MEPVAEKVCTILACTNVQDFLEAISPSAETFKEFGPNSWYFRGHADDSFQLVPSALRQESKLLRDFVSGGFRTNEEQIFGEMHALRLFFDEADRIGLHLPEDSQVVRRIFEKHYAHQLPSNWPPRHLLSLMAIAQHHGFPTRLLDWSRNVLKASYFAASGAAKGGSRGSKKLAVWALSIWPFMMKADTPLKIVTAPGFTNRNLLAQEGIFTRTRSIKPNQTFVDRRPLDKILESEIKEFTPIGTSLYRITLPSKLAPELLYELARRGVSHSTLFPDFYGVVQALREKNLWPE